MKKLLIGIFFLPVFLFSQSLTIPQIRVPLVDGLDGVFSATFQGTSVSDFFKIVSDQSGLNLMVSSKVNATVTASYKNVSLKDAMLAILSANNLYAIESGSIVQIFTADEYKTELKKNYLSYKAYDASIMDIKNIRPFLQPLLTPEIGSFAVDEKSSKIMVYDIQENFGRIDKLFRELSSVPTMIQIETKIIQVELKNEDSYGIDWEILQNGESIVKVNFKPELGNQLSVNSLNSIFPDIDLKVFLNALSKKRNTKLISQPRVLAVNRGKAVINIGSKVPFIKSTTTSGTTEKTTSEVEFIDVGTRIEVEPEVSSDNEVRLRIKVVVSEYERVSISKDEDAPQLTTTEVECDSVSRNGDSILIGGLIKESEGENDNAVPILGSIPILDWFFSNKDFTKHRSELLIILWLTGKIAKRFFTPKVMMNLAT